jgi:hypothetical protein
MVIDLKAYRLAKSKVEALVKKDKKYDPYNWCRFW